MLKKRKARKKMAEGKRKKKKKVHGCVMASGA